jgi:hypothetical protein
MDAVELYNMELLLYTVLGHTRSVESSYLHSYKKATHSLTHPPSHSLTHSNHVFIQHVQRTAVGSTLHNTVRNCPSIPNMYARKGSLMQICPPKHSSRHAGHTPETWNSRWTQSSWSCDWCLHLAYINPKSGRLRTLSREAGDYSRRTSSQDHPEVATRIHEISR